MLFYFIILAGDSTVTNRTLAENGFDITVKTLISRRLVVEICSSE